MVPTGTRFRVCAPSGMMVVKYVGQGVDHLAPFSCSGYNRFMADIWFYHLTSLPLERALPTLLSKTLAREKRAVVMTGNEQRIDAINTLLWTYDPSSWLPHGSAADGDPEMQPVWLTVEDENPNGAQFLFLTDRAMSDKVADYERVIMLFDDRDHDAVAEARTRWKDWKEAGHKLSYWQQTPQGAWEKKAES